MGNKTGKFNVPATEKTNKDEQVINEEGTAETPVIVESNGDQPKQESNGVEKTETAPEVKKKSIVSWFKKVSMRKEKKSKTPKENGVKEDVESPKENGTVEEANETVKENGKCEVVSDKVETVEIPEVHTEEKEVSPEVTEIKEETPIANGHDTEVENSEAKEEQ